MKRPLNDLANLLHQPVESTVESGHSLRPLIGTRRLCWSISVAKPHVFIEA